MNESELLKENVEPIKTSVEERVKKLEDEVSQLKTQVEHLLKVQMAQQNPPPIAESVAKHVVSQRQEVVSPLPSSAIIEEVKQYATLIDVINNVKRAEKQFPKALTIYFSLEFIR